MSWDPLQREILAELGHVLYRTTTTALPEFASADLRGSGASGPEAALLARLARAAAVPVDALPTALCEPQALARLRGDGAAKRALWPRLRALRASGP